MNSKTMGDRIKYHRKQMGLTQEQLAERLGVSAQAVSKWENNPSCPDISILPELASIFGISVDALLGHQTAQTETVHEAQPVEEEGDKPIWKLDHSLSFSGLGFALYVLTVGGLLLAGALIPAMEISWWTIVWTTALLYIGLSGLVGGFSVFSLGMACGGIFFLLEAYGLIQLQLRWGIVLPALLIIWGVSLLADVLLGKKRRKKKKSTRKLHHEYDCNNGELHCEMSFGEYRAAVVTPLLRGGSIDSSFGDFTVDFSACETLAPDCALEVSNSFGQLTLLIPEKFAVILEPKSTFAAAPEIKGSPSETVEGTLLLRTSLSFGAMEIRYI